MIPGIYLTPSRFARLPSPLAERGWGCGSTVPLNLANRLFRQQITIVYSRFELFHTVRQAFLIDFVKRREVHQESILVIVTIVTFAPPHDLEFIFAIQADGRLIRDAYFEHAVFGFQINAA